MESEWEWLDQYLCVHNDGISEPRTPALLLDLSAAVIRVDRRWSASADTLRVYQL